MQALILAGGEGTRLRPLTSTIPKPVVPLVDRPFITYMLEWLSSHGIDEVILSCGFLADGVRRVLGDGASLGMRLHYVEEPAPLGTGGALKLAEELLDERFFMLNGDVLADLDLSAQLEQHERTGAQATLALIGVDDPSAYGLVRLHPDGSVGEFVEKPRPEQIDSNLISAGAYILERDVLDGMAPAGTNISIEREVFPTLIDRGLFGYAASGYWLDIGTPERYLQGTYDILEGNVTTQIGRLLQEAGLILAEEATIEGKIIAPAIAGAGSVVEKHAVIGAHTVLGRGVRVHEGARVEGSVLLDGTTVGAGATIRRSIVGPGAAIGEGCRIEGDVVIGEGARIAPNSVLEAGARIFPGVEHPEAAISS